MPLSSLRSPFRLAGALALTAAAIAVPAPALMAQDIPVVSGMMPSDDVITLAPDGLEKALAALPALVTATLERSGIPGAAVAVVHGGETVFARGFGVRELGRPEPVDADTVFQIASL
ncbi:MAG: serine hydrolase, partial [Planctomycetales bacterium]|nr:serine hydrolase [Planctomycetales bacterium]